MIYWTAIWWSRSESSDWRKMAYNSGSWSSGMGLSLLYERRNLWNISEGFYSVM